MIQIVKNPLLPLTIALVYLVIGSADGAEHAETRLPRETLEPFLKTYCVRCHGPEEQKGKMRLDTLSLQMDTGTIAGRWQDVLDALNAGDMPPEDEKQPTKR